MGHFGQARTFTTEKIAHVGATFGFAATESVDPFAFALASSGLLPPRRHTTAGLHTMRCCPLRLFRRPTRYFRTRFCHQIITLICRTV